MQKNSLSSDQVRHGWVSFVDDDPLPAVLRRRDAGFVVDIASKIAGPNARWPEKIYSHLANPHLIDFHFRDHLGQVELINCLRGDITSIGPSVGVENWEFMPMTVVFNGNGSTWSSIVTVESEVPMLRYWLGQNAHLYKSELLKGEDWLQIRLTRRREIEVCGQLSHIIATDSRTKPDPQTGGTCIYNKTQIITKLNSPQERDVALAEHQSITDLLSIFYGLLVGPADIQIEGSENPMRDLNGNEMGFLNTCAVEMNRSWKFLDHPEPGEHYEAFLEGFEVDGAIFSRWLEFSRNNAEAVHSLLRALSEEAHWENRLLNLAVAFEEFGHGLEGNLQQETHKDNFPTYLKRICLSMPRLCLMRPEQWARRFNRAYKGVKHADNEHPELEEIVKVTQQGLIWLRAWCCFQIAPNAPIMDAKWRRFHYFYEFTPQPDEEENWITLLTAQDWDEEADRQERDGKDE